MGRSATGSAERVSIFSRSCWKFSKVLTELRRSTRRPSRNVALNTALHQKQLVVVSPAEMSSQDSRKRVRNRSLGTKVFFRFGLVRIPHGFCGKVQDN